MLRNLLSRMDSIFSRIIWGFLLFVKKDKIFKLTLFALEFHSSKVKNAVQLSLKMTLNSCSTFASKCIKLKIGPSRVKVQDFSCLEVEGNSGVTLAIFSAVKRKRIWVSLLALGLRWHKSLVGLYSLQFNCKVGWLIWFSDIFILQLILPPHGWKYFLGHEVWRLINPQ